MSVLPAEERPLAAPEEPVETRATRARELLAADDPSVRGGTADALRFFLERRPTGLGLHDAAVQEAFLALDDAEVTVSLKRWARGADAVLAEVRGTPLDITRLTRPDRPTL